MIKYIWIIMLLILYAAWGIYAAYDFYLSFKTKLKCEELSIAFIYVTLAAIFLFSFVSWLGSFQYSNY